LLYALSPAPCSTSTVMPFLVSVATASGSRDTRVSADDSFKIPIVIPIDCAFKVRKIWFRVGKVLMSILLCVE
jgi:hypothetical protein